MADLLAKLRRTGPRYADLQPADVAARLTIEPGATKPATRTDGEDRSEPDTATWGVVIRYRGDVEVGEILTRELATQFTHEYIFRPALAAQNRLNASIAAMEEKTQQRTAADAARIDLEARLEYVRLALSELPEVEQLEAVLAEPQLPASASADPTSAALSSEGGLTLIRNQLAAVDARLAEASEMYTPAHPVLQSLASQRQLLEQELQSQENSAIDAAGNQRQLESQQRRELARLSLAKREDLESQLVELTAKLEKHLELATQVDESLQQLTDEQRLIEAEWLQHDQVEVVVSEPTRESTRQGSTNFTAILFAMCLGTFGAVVVSTIGLPGDSILRNAEQTAEAISLPVIASLPCTEASPEAVPYRIPRGTRVVKLAAEFVLSVMLLSTTALAIFQVGYLEQLAENPLGELADSVRNLWVFLGG